MQSIKIQVCIIEPSFFNTTSGKHRRPFDGRHLVYFPIKLCLQWEEIEATEGMLQDTGKSAVFLVYRLGNRSFLKSI